MKIAFYAPMKSPDHPVPSGDRTVARLLFATLESMGHEVCLASSLRSWDGGDPRRQRRLACAGAREAAELVGRWRRRRPGLWFTYHLYHKAPDHLGPRVADALDLPYVVAEPSVSSARKTGPWREGHARSLAALARADALLPVTENDREGLLSAGLPADRMILLAPFVDDSPSPAPRAKARMSLARRWDVAGDGPLAAVVAMMRPGDKLASYRLLAEALATLDRPQLRLLVLGDGPCRGEVEALLAGRAAFAGELPPDEVRAVLGGCDMLLWPAVNEAYGMALLAAQVAGLPVVAGHAPGVAEIVAHGETGLLAAPGDAAAFARAAAALIDCPQRREAMGRAAAARARARHSRAAAAATLGRALDMARGARCPRSP